jgi:hypothetical protein
VPYKVSSNTVSTNSINTAYSLPSFKAVNFTSQIRTNLSTKEENQKYNKITSMVDKKFKKDFRQI